MSDLKIRRNLLPTKRFHHFRLKKPSPELKLDLDFEDLFSDGRTLQKSDYFLGILTQDTIRKVFRKAGVYDILEQKGILNPLIKMDTSDPYRQKLWVYIDKFSPETIVTEIVLHKCTVEIEHLILDDFRNRLYNVLHIEWMLLQNPNAEFTKERPRLPGQKFPGLGMGNLIMDMLVLTGRTLKMDALSNVPNYLHTAFIFTREFKFVHPEKQGLIDAMKRDLLHDYPFHKVAWAMVYEAIKSEKTGNYFKWEPEELIFPLTYRLKDYFNSEEYRKRRHKAYHENRFSIDEDKYKLRMRKTGRSIDV